MYKIAICDDEKKFCTRFESDLHEVAKQLQLKFDISIWYSGEGLCSYLSESNYLDIVFLDIELIRITGISVGHYIRNDLENQHIQIVYISSKSNYALQLFKTQPFDFLLKPIDISYLQELIRKIVKSLKTQDNVFGFQFKGHIYRIPYDEILYFKSDKRKIEIITLKKKYQYYDKISNIVKKCPKNFWIIHKSYLVNQNHVITYGYEYLEMSNKDILTISRSLQKEVRKSVLDLRGAR